MKESPLLEDSVGIVMFREEEHIGNTNRLNNLLDSYVECKIHEYFNLTITDFMKLPTIEIDLLCSSAIRNMEREDVIKARAAKKLDEGG